MAICGGGLAGLLLALQLRRDFPEMRVVLIDRLKRPFPAGAFKVGESFTEAGSHYLDSVVPGYFGEKHLFKMGFRFFLNGPETHLERRPELGLVRFPIVPSYNVDRGGAEEDLRVFAEAAGVMLFEGYRVRDVTLATDVQPHRLDIEDVESGETTVLSARWVIDATGRRRLLQRKLGLSKALGQPSGGSWFRLAGRVDVSDMVPAGEIGWHGRVPDNLRYFSTNHLAGPGYWVWIIPLSCDMTSIGIVALDEYQPFEGFNTYERSMEWLREHEPAFAEHIKDMPPIDFGAMRDYSYSAKQVFSAQRWACVGEAAVFSDPLYAQGGDLIAYANNTVVDLIRCDRDGTLTDDIVKHYNQSFIAINESLTYNVQMAYRVFERPPVLFAKAVWDFVAGWSFFAPQIYNPSLNNPQQGMAIRKARSAYYFLTKRMQELFADWVSRPESRLTFEFIDFISISLLREARDRNLRADKSAEELIEDHHYAMGRAEELAIALFLIAVDDVMPERLAELRAAGWLNAWAVSLDPERWESDKLFEPSTPSRDLTSLYNELRALFSIERRVAA